MEEEIDFNLNEAFVKAIIDSGDREIFAEIFRIDPRYFYFSFFIAPEETYLTDKKLFKVGGIEKTNSDFDINKSNYSEELKNEKLKKYYIFGLKKAILFQMDKNPKWRELLIKEVQKYDEQTRFDQLRCYYIIFGNEIIERNCYRILEDYNEKIYKQV